MRLDCLEPQYLNEETIELLVSLIRNYPITMSIRNISSIPQSRTEKEGFKSGKHDLDRIALLRKATELDVQYFELEHHLRRNFFLPGEPGPKVIILYSNMKETPEIGKLRDIYSDIIRQGADYVLFETLVRNRKGDRGEIDRQNLKKLVQESLSGESSRPLTVVGRGKHGRDLNLEMYKERLVPFVYGVIPSFSPVPFLSRARTYTELPKLDEVIESLKKQ